MYSFRYKMSGEPGGKWQLSTFVFATEQTPALEGREKYETSLFIGSELAMRRFEWEAMLAPGGPKSWERREDADAFFRKAAHRARGVQITD